jgi:membrane-associated phospholipid phosphatase
MHWPTDVAASVVFTVTWLLLLRAVLLSPVDPDGAHPGGGAP